MTDQALSPRQLDVLRLAAVGHSGKSAARELGVSPRTVEIHRGTALRKLGALTIAHAVAIAFTKGMLP